MTHNPDTSFLPCAQDAQGGAEQPIILADQAFSYIGTPLTAAAFVAYTRAYDFGPILPSQIVIHHTANPDASWAAALSDPATRWDRNEVGLTEAQIRTKRKGQLDAIKNYYVGLGWSTGPHLFCDDKWLWLFTPMADIGTHAKSGNSYRIGGKLHYSLGIEVVGFYAKVGWPPAIQLLLRTAVQALHDRLGTFEIVYKPAPINRPDLHDGSVAFHRDYNKPACPGAVINPAYAIPILSAVPPGLHKYRARYRVAVFEQQTGMGPAWGTLEAGTVVVTDKDDYPEGTVHDAAGRGFLWKKDLERV